MLLTFNAQGTYLIEMIAVQVCIHAKKTPYYSPYGVRKILGERDTYAIVSCHNI